MPKDSLASFVSGSIARSNPLEGGPEFDAMLNGSGVIASTWGDYATRLMDISGCEPHEAIAKLRLSPGDLSDPTVYFEGGRGFNDYMHRTKERFVEEAKADLDIEVRRLQGIVDTVMEGYVLPDQEVATEEASAFQDEISEVMRRSRGVEETEEQRREQTIRCMERDALYSGVRIPLDEFVVTMLSTNVIDPEFGSELGGEWVQAMMDAVDDFWGDHVQPDFPIGQMIAGRDLFMKFKQYLAGSTYYPAHRYADERWAEIEPVFRARSLQDVPLINGSDRSPLSLGGDVSEDPDSN